MSKGEVALYLMNHKIRLRLKHQKERRVEERRNYILNLQMKRGKFQMICKIKKDLKLLIELKRSLWVEILRIMKH